MKIIADKFFFFNSNICWWYMCVQPQY